MQPVLIDGDLELTWDSPRYIPRQRQRPSNAPKVNYMPIAGILLATTLLVSSSLWQAQNHTNDITAEVPSLENAMVADKNVGTVEFAGVDIDGAILNHPTETAHHSVQTSVEKASYTSRTINKSQIKYWAKRINSYLSGTKLAGKGETFARAALRSHIDPRLSVAISQMESQRGLHTPENCEYNYWGVTRPSGKFYDYPSSSNAIYEHAAMIARVYGHDATPENMSRKYCPPNWKNWQRVVRDNMNKISE